ncbi:MAG: GTPase [Candidatus Brocadia sp.]
MSLRNVVVIANSCYYYFMEAKKKQSTDTFLKGKTITAIATPLGEGGIGKIIVSGPNALGHMNTIFHGKGIADLRKAKSKKLYYGHIFDGGQRVDEVILNVVKQRDSFTGQDIIEVNCHGGIRILKHIYECLQSAGAEGVGWDSLLLQSCENDKMDFIQKEALQEVVRARTKLGVKVLLDQYAGALSGALQKGLEIIEWFRQSLSKGADDLSQRNDVLVSNLVTLIGQLLETAPLGMTLTTPKVLVILGKPNVGKSTIINTILGEERMLVHHEPGTTRDYVSEFISVEGIPFELVDTAGMRDTSDKLEAMGIEITQEQLNRSDKVIAVFDNSRPFDREDEGVLDALNSWLKAESFNNLRRKGDMNAIIPVVNKCDLPAKLDRLRIESVLRQHVCSISALNKDGFEDLRRRLVKELDTEYKPMRPVVFNRRQSELLAKADGFIKQKKDCFMAKNKKSEVLQVIDELKDIFMACLKGS